MAPRGKPSEEEPKRLNRVVAAGEAVAKVLDPAMRKRGFASRDLLLHWAAMAPAPYDKVAIPDRLSWPRGERGADGATLYLRCAPGHGLALAHEAPLIAASVNRYFGYVLVSNVRLSAEPFSAGSSGRKQVEPAVPFPDPPDLGGAVAKVQDAGLKEALRRLGRGIMAGGKR